MNAEFASALVTVIPIILLVASVEINNVTKSRQARLLRELEFQLEDAEAAILAGQPVSDGKPRKSRTETIAYVFWGVLMVTHVVAEMILILWLASAKRPEVPFLAEYVLDTALFGFISVFTGGLLSHDLTRREYLDQLEEIKRRRTRAFVETATAQLASGDDPGRSD
ncbi:DUF4499 domain-containing protein [Streptomyces sp. AC512_CC834]|uniref:DUF4499 domain-containing protein n=1 Tax=Streptomyces sp. AC512_CC834 TaxID=2823691 RepID=UPI001C26FA53|nr:DUF4499 domain-containing protein [Streptomyces sp. AC512_CC834]